MPHDVSRDRVLVVGEALVDVVDGQALPGGSPLNVAVGLQRLGLPATLHSHFGADPNGVVIAQHGFSRYVLVDEEGEPSGYVHLKDVLDLDDDEYTEPVPPKRIRQLISLYREMELEDALATLRRAGSHVARVFDEHGATRGVLFLEDIIEELVGEVQDATRRQP